MELSMREHQEYFGVDKKTYSHIKNKHEIEYLCFFDSRGSSPLSEDKSFSKKLNHFFSEKDITHLIICRPVNNTTFFSLFNFLHLNKLRFTKLITNMGLVDFTPKKQEVIDDIVYQKQLLFSQYQTKINELEEYLLSDGNYQKLFNLNLSIFSEKFTNILEKEFDKTYLMLTMEFPKKCVFERERPDSFYSQLTNTNQFLKDMEKRSNNIELIPAPLIDDDYLKYSTDGIHFTVFSHNCMFNNIKSFVTDS